MPRRPLSALGPAVALALAGAAAQAATPRAPGDIPGGDRDSLPLWINDFFELGALSGRTLVNPSNPVHKAVGVAVGAVCPELNAAPAASLSPGATDLRARCNEIVAGLVDDQDQAGALDGLQAMGAEENSVIASTEVDQSSAHRADIGERLADLRAGLGGPAVSLNGQALDPGARGGNAGLGGGRWSFFIDGSWGWGDKDASAVESGFDMDSYGVTAGLDYRASPSTVMGGALGYTRLEADLAADAGKLDTDSASVFVYSSFTGSDDWYLDAMLGWTGSDHDQERNLRYRIRNLANTATVGIDQRARASNESREWSMSLQLGRSFYGEGWSLGPYGRLDYADVDIDGYRERMTRPAAPGRGLAVAIDDQEYQSLTLALGVSGYTRVPMSWGSLLPQFTAEYVHEYDNDNEPITGYFVDALSRTRFSIPTDEPDRDYLNLALGVTALVGDATSAYLQYSTLQGYRGQSLDEVRLGVKVDF